MTPKQVHKQIKIIKAEKVFDGNLDLSLEKLTSLEPYNLSDVIVTGYFSCSYNKLTSLKGSPKQINGNFWCANNNLTSLIGAPKQVGRDFWCNNNNLTSLEGLPETIDGDIVIEKEVLQRLYFTNDLIALYDLHDKFYLV